MTIAGDTSGTWVGATNGIGVSLFFGLGVGTTYSGTAGAWAATNYISATGAVSVVGTNGATFYITGVQLEKGSVATPFEFRPYGTELALCQRYYYRWQSNSSGVYSVSPFFGMAISTTSINVNFSPPVTLRATPTVLDVANLCATDEASSLGITASALVGATEATSGSAVYLQFATSGATQYRPYFIRANNSAAAYIGIGAEL